VNNAGVSRVGPHTQDTTDDDWHVSVNVMQTGVFYCMRAAARYFLEQQSGSIVNIASIRGFSPNPGRIAYCATKAAVLMMTRVAAAEWAPFGVRVNAVAPGPVRTPMWDADVERGVLDEQAYLRNIPARRLATPHEIGRQVVYLCSDDASYVNGACLTIDGALTSIPIG
jgi:NAD(P)-dependent dehydrogenase (short-subunit alcohol dehydrogenase family)